MDDPLALRPSARLQTAADPVTRPGPSVGALAGPLPELQTRVPNLGPYTMGSGLYHLQVYPGPMLKMVTAPATSQSLDVIA